MDRQGSGSGLGACAVAHAPVPRCREPENAIFKRNSLVCQPEQGTPKGERGGGCVLWAWAGTPCARRTRLITMGGGIMGGAATAIYGATGGAAAGHLARSIVTDED